MARSLIARFRQWHLMVLLGAGMVGALLAREFWISAAAMAYLTWSGARELRMIARANEHDARMRGRL